VDPAEVVEWLVATAESPVTRGQTTGELRWAVTSLADLAKRAGESVASAAERLVLVLQRFHEEGGAVRQAPAELLRALLTPGPKARLTAALRSTDRFGQAD